MLIDAPHPSIAAARVMLAGRGAGVAHVRYDATVGRPGGYALFFTVVSRHGRLAMLVKVCEDWRGRVTGASDVSEGDASC